MTPVEARTRFLEDHTYLRGKASVLKSLALNVLRGDEDLGTALVLKGKDLLLHMVRHMRWEEDTLLPHLRRLDCDAAAAADRVFFDHQSQRVRLADSLFSLEGAGRVPRELASSLLDLIAWLESDMEAEEANVLSALSLAAHESPAPEDGPPPRARS